MFDWDDLRFALALHEHGSLVAASRALRVDPTTVGRRVASLESALGRPVFLRSGGDWIPTPPGRRILDAAQRAADALEHVRRVGEHDTPRGPVRVTTIEAIASNLLVPLLPGFSERYPQVRVHVWCSTRRLEVGREVDLAIRVGDPTGPDLIAKRLAFLREGLFAAPGWLQTRGLDPATVTSLDGLPLCSIGRVSPLLQGCGAYREVLRSDSVITVARAVQEGLGVALLPDLIAREMGLVALPRLPSHDELPMWLVTHPDLLQVPRVRVLFDAIAGAAVAQG